MSMPEAKKTRIPWALGLTVAAIAAIGTFVATALLMNVHERKEEARQTFFAVAAVDDDTVDPAVWGRNFPLHYDAYRRTVDQQRTRFGGSEGVPRTPSEADPRSVVAQSKLEEDPRLRAMWNGYAFAIDFREERGHAYMLEDQSFTGRHAKPQPGACLNCHASSYATYKQLGNGDIAAGFDKLCAMPYADARPLVEHPVACIDCHDPADMALRITRPSFAEGIRALKAAQGVPDYDVHRDASRQEMRSFVCAQCHVEYYFKGDGKRLTYPWQQGLGGDDILAYYDAVGHTDWKHAETGAPMLKAQHPEFELWSMGIHARSGVSCADCHMPYMRVGAAKISDHHVRSPLLNINHACQTCHRQAEDELRGRVETIQEKTYEMRNIALNALSEYIGAIKGAQMSGAAGEVLERAREFQRKATFLIDFVEAENSTGFHAPQEAARLLFNAMDHLRNGERVLLEDPKASGVAPMAAAAADRAS